MNHRANRLGRHFPGAFNVIATIGSSTINTIIGVQTLRAVSDTHRLPMAVGIVLIAVVTLIPSFLGYRFVHAYERWAALIPAIIFIIMLGEGAKYMESGPWGGSGSVEAANVLSSGASVFGFGVGWVSVAADYTVNMPADASASAIFIATCSPISLQLDPGPDEPSFSADAGLNIPLILIQSLGTAYMTTLSAQPTWAAKH